ncbi:hypothetical protein DFP73DRAFT_559507 [Morchella snyderi]|nr:hypothetical protein DFP73DRAFT_559507 [Morchella snyderi]
MFKIRVAFIFSCGFLSAAATYLCMLQYYYASRCYYSIFALRLYYLVFASSLSISLWLGLFFWLFLRGLYSICSSG